MNQNIYRQFLPHFESNPNKILIDTPEGKSYCYQEVLESSQRLVSVLIGLHVKPGDRVVVQVEKSPQVVMLYLACLQIGAVYLPLNTAYTDAEVEYFIGDAEPQLYICTPENLTNAQRFAQNGGVGQVESLGVDADGTLMELAEKADRTTEIAELQGNDLAAILYTSGTTGRAKGAMLSHTNLASNSLALMKAWHYTAEDHLLHALPIFHTHGLFVACNVTLTAGASMTFMARFDVEQLLDLMPGATVLMGVPTFYTRLLKSSRLDNVAVRNMRLFISGSAPLLAETHEQFQARTGHAILERYGMTETNMNTSNPYSGARIPGTVGRPLPGVEVHITDHESGIELPQGEIGMVEIRGPNVFQGYWRMPEKTRADFRDNGFFITGDLGRIDENGYLQIVGRGKDLVISGGFNVYPKEIEQVIDELPGVVESAVIGVEHPDLGEGVTAVVVAEAGASLTESDVIKSLRDRLARYKQPKRVVFVDSLPRNVMGKVQKKQLRETYAGIYQ